MVIDRPGLPTDRDQECTALARDLMDNWKSYFPQDACPYSAPIVTFSRAAANTKAREF